MAKTRSAASKKKAGFNNQRVAAKAPRGRGSKQKARGGAAGGSKPAENRSSTRGAARDGIGGGESVTTGGNDAEVQTNSQQQQQVQGDEMVIQRPSEATLNRIQQIQQQQRSVRSEFEMHGNIHREVVTVDLGGQENPDLRIAVQNTDRSVAIPSGVLQRSQSAMTPIVTDYVDLELQRLTARRDLFKRSLLSSISDLQNLLAASTLDEITAKSKMARLEDVHMQFKAMNGRVLDALIGRNTPALSLDQELQSSLDIDESVIKIQEELRKRGVLMGAFGIGKVGNEHGEKTAHQMELPYRLPEMEVVKFDGRSEAWLSWWGRFRVIHETERVPVLAKFHYLLQSLAPGSKAEMTVKALDVTEANYPIAIKRLKDRCGDESEIRDGLVREIIQLVNTAAIEKTPFITLYDQLECKLAALGSLGESARQQCQVLVAQVEVALPMEMAKSWERRKQQLKAATGNQNNLLDLFMDFLREEVKLEEKISKAKGMVDRSSLLQAGAPKVPTVANLVASTPATPQGSGQKRKNPVNGNNSANAKKRSKTTACGFCTGDHLTKNCNKPTNWTHREKTDLLKKNGCCFRCFNQGHMARNCESKIRCAKCSGRHYPIMCNGRSVQVGDKPVDKKQSERQVEFTDEKPATSKNSRTFEKPQDRNGPKITRTVNNCLNMDRAETPLQTVKVWMTGPEGKKMVRALLDSGASKSAILAKTARELGLEKFASEKISHNLYGGGETKEVEHGFYQVRLMSICGEYEACLRMMDEKQIVNQITSKTSDILLSKLTEAGVVLTDCNSEGEIELLLGNDIYGQLLTGNIKRLPIGAYGYEDEDRATISDGMKSTPEMTAMETVFGWVLSGYSEVLGPQVSRITNLLSRASVSQLMDLDVLGIKDPIEAKSKKEVEEDIQAYFQQTVKQLDNGHYNIKLPFMMDKASLPNNFNQAQQRLEAALKKLDRTNYREQYGKIFDEWAQEGIIEEIPLDDMRTGKFFYLPHRPVFKFDSATTKIRPVFDASCKQGGSFSLNEILAKGPNLLERISHILTKFRLGQVAAISDIRKAFLQIEVNEEDRDVLRFLWKDSEGNLKLYRHKRVVFGVNCSPFLLAAVLEKHLKTSEEEPEIARKLLDSMYVDNSVASFENEEDYRRFREVSVQLLANAKFDLRMWESNVDPDEAETTKVLGMIWNKSKDTLSAKVGKVQVPEKLTKRNLLAAAHSLFDPLGICAPATLIPKLLLRDKTVKDLSWDDEVPDDIKVKFTRWCEEVPLLKNVQVFRPLAEVNPTEGSWSLHVFCDASQDAFAAVAFVRVETEDGVTVRLVEARSRLAPTKATIPRLELLACLIGARLAKSILEAVGQNWPIFLWSDSSTALAWIRRPIVWGVFVENRVKEIRKTHDLKSWRFVPGLKNPADIPSRGLYPSKFVDSKWIEGPAWLRQPQHLWPSTNQPIDENLVKVEKRKTAVLTAQVTPAQRPWNCRTTGYRRNVRIVAYLLRWLRRKEGLVEAKDTTLLPQELEFAERVIWASIQEEIGLEVKMDSSVMKRKNGTSKKVGLGLKLVKRNGLWSVNTRLTMKKDTEGFMWPVYLPNDHEIVQLLIEAVHLENFHAGPGIVLAKLREMVWIQNGRQTVKKAINKCVACRRDRGKKLEAAMAPLPMDRMVATRVFEVSGVDYGGQLYLRSGEKVWIAIFTCAVFRALHLELVPSLTTEAFVQVFRRFRNRRGQVAKVYSDCGTNFKGYKRLMDSIDWDQVKKTSGMDKVVWQLNPPASPWWGGWWERLVQMIKQLLRRTFGSASLDREEMETALTDAEAILNSRPLTAVTDDVSDLRPLTPNMFLLDMPAVESLDIDLVETLGYPYLYQNRQAARQELKERFRAEYLGSLAAMGTDPKSKDVKVGDVVLVEVDNNKRVLWPLGRIMELIPGRDGVSRLAKLKTAKGELLRPVQRLVPLGIESSPGSLQVSEIHSSAEGAASQDVQQGEPHEAQLQDPSESVVVTRSGRISKKPDRF